MKNEEQARSLFGISLSDRPKWQQFLICSSGFFFGYLVNGICEEYVYNRLQFSYGWYFTFVQGFVYLVLIYLQGFTTKQMVNPWKTYVKLSAVLMGSHGLTKGSLAFLNYPAQIMFKSTKVLPVMIMGAFIPGLRRKYPVHEYISALFLVFGLILFTMADAQTSPNFNMIGVIMISGALVMDSFLGNLQEAIFTMNPDTTQMEMLFCSTVVGLPFLLAPMILTGELFRAWDSCSQDWRSEDEKEQFSPVSVLDCPFEDEKGSDSPPLHHGLARIDGTKQKLRRFESLAKLEPIDLEKRIASFELDNKFLEPLTRSFENRDEEEDETDVKVQELLKLMKSTTSCNGFSVMCKAENLLIADFFREKLAENKAKTEGRNLLKEAGDWINGQSQELFLGWDVKDGRKAYVQDMEKNGKWWSVVEEKEEVGLALELQIFTSLVNELLTD